MDRKWRNPWQHGQVPGISTAMTRPNCEVMKVIMGVFLQITFYVASNDDVIMMSQKERPKKRGKDLGCGEMFH